jgi:hypothetical protein|tara:strand:- start:195 stop:404 length:210 start_codon:yes stop_codon:yes gene_type:complete
MNSEIKDDILTNNLRKTLKILIQGEIEKLPETLDKLESNERLNILLKLMPYVFPKVQKIHSNEGEPLEW